LLGEVDVVRRNDGDGVDAVWALDSAVAISAEGGVGAVWGDVEVLAAFAGFFGVGGEGGGYQFEVVVDARGYAVDCADEAAWAAAYHA